MTAASLSTSRTQRRWRMPRSQSEPFMSPWNRYRSSRDIWRASALHVTHAHAYPMLGRKWSSCSFSIYIFFYVPLIGSLDDYCLQSDSFVSVSQFHLHGWPREGVPPSASMMLELVEQSRKHWRETGFNLIAVHTATE